MRVTRLAHTTDMLTASGCDVVCPRTFAMSSEAQRACAVRNIRALLASWSFSNCLCW